MESKQRVLRHYGKVFPVSKWHWMGEEIAVICPECRALARFTPATLRSLAPSQLEATRKLGSIDVFEVEEPNRPGIFRHYGAFFHQMGQLPPEGWELPERWASFVGTLRCQTCALVRKHVLTWPAEAYFQLDFDGQLLWFYNRDHVQSLIALLQAQHPRSLPRFYWFNNILPSHFKSEKARKLLPARLKKLAAQGGIAVT